jgi:hypothetical protein
MPSKQTLLLQCLEAAGRAAGGEDEAEGGHAATPFAT